MSDTQVISTERPRWGSRLAFLFAAIGAAVGLGNFWRFPYLSFKFGGAVFLIPYFIALLVIGIPILLLELSLGQKFQSGSVGSYGKLHPKMRGVGLIAVFSAFIIACYYNSIIAWSVVFFFDSFKSPLPWTEDADSWLNNGVLLRPDSLEAGAGITNARLLYAILFVWVFIFFATLKGPSLIGKVVFVTIPLPFLLLIVLFFRGITLDGAGLGISAYLGHWDLSHLGSPDIWISAAGQIFFTLSVCQGTMIAYASFNKQNQDVVKDNFIISITNSVVSILCGFVVFTILGHLAHISGVPLGEVTRSGPGLTFVVFPAALALLPWPNFFSFLFFLTIFTLGVTSSFSMVEGLACVLRDMPLLKNVRKEFITLCISFTGFVLGTLFVLDIGSYLIDIVDHFVSNYLLVIVGILECIGAGWIYGNEELMAKAGSKAVLIYNLSFLTAIVSGCFLTAIFFNFIGAWAFLIFIPLMVALIGLGIFLSFRKARSRGCRDNLWMLFGFHGPDTFRHFINRRIDEMEHETTPGKKNWKIKRPWSIAIKYVIPFILFILLTLELVEDIAHGYENYPWWGQLIGILVIITGLTLLILPAAWSRIGDLFIDINFEHYSKMGERIPEVEEIPQSSL